jgi:hypothetical protein
MEIPPKNWVVSVMKDRGGSSFGALGIRVPVQPSTGTKRALRGRTTEHTTPKMMDMLTGVMKPSAMDRIRREIGGLWTEGTGVIG